jgi:hypothetical protein
VSLFISWLCFGGISVTHVELSCMSVLFG